MARKPRFNRRKTGKSSGEHVFVRPGSTAREKTRSVPILFSFHLQSGGPKVLIDLTDTAQAGCRAGDACYNNRWQTEDNPLARTSIFPSTNAKQQRVR